MSNKTTARIVGALILTATVTYIIGSGLIGSILDAPDFLRQVYQNSTQVVSGVLIMFVAATANVGIGVLLFSILRKHSEPVALGYVVTRIFDGAGVVVSGSFALLLIALSQGYVQAGAPDASYLQELGALLVAGSETAFVVTMIALGLGSIPFCYLLYRTRLILRSIAVLGLVGYAALFIGSSLELFGLNLSMIHYAPGGLFELIFPIWLIVKGFNSPTISPESANPDDGVLTGVSQSAVVPSNGRVPSNG